MTLTAKWTAEKIVAIFIKSDASLATDAGFTITGTAGYKTATETFTYDGVEYSSPLKIQSGNTITFTTASTMKINVMLHSGGKQTILIDGTSYTADSGGIIEATIEAGDHVIARDSGEAWLCYIVLESVSA